MVDRYEADIPKFPFNFESVVEAMLRTNESGAAILVEKSIRL